MAVLKKRRFKSMFWRSFALIVVIVLFSLLISGVFLLALSSSYWKEQTLNRLMNEAKNLSANAELVMDSFSADPMIDDTRLAEAMRYAVQTVEKTAECDVLLVNLNGLVVLCGDNPMDAESAGLYTCEKHAGMRLDDELMELLRTSENGGYSGDVSLKNPDDDYLLACDTIYREREPSYFVILMKQKVLAFRSISKYSGMVVFSSTIAVVLSFFAAYIVCIWIVRPLKKISDATNRYAKGEFNYRIDPNETYLEVKDLADSVNGMAESLERIEESRSNFVANVSHELKTPMTIISGFIDGMLDGTIEPSEHEKYLSVVSDETKRLSKLVVDMLNMSKMEAGRLTLNDSDVELSSLLLKLALLFEQPIEEKKIALLGLDTLERTVIRADEGLINQVFYNLLDNAVKFTPKNGTISVNMTANKKNAVVSIRNTGKGIPEKDRALIFDRFYKVDKSRGMDSGSFGIGLPIAKSIVELHHGSIGINSRENEYTEFVVTLPVQLNAT
ncbi:MAG: HAMP domain-containing histidine kinase [Clostridia bacterium]|nr:HAMP domain-containing histidine kinase [Clostridia bacterium]